MWCSCTEGWEGDDTFDWSDRYNIMINKPVLGGVTDYQAFARSQLFYQFKNQNWKTIQQRLLRNLLFQSMYRYNKSQVHTCTRKKGLTAPEIKDIESIFRAGMKGELNVALSYTCHPQPRPHPLHKGCVGLRETACLPSRVPSAFTEID